MVESKPIQFGVRNENGECHLTTTHDGTPSQLMDSMAHISGGKDMEFATTLLTNVAEVVSPDRPSWAFNQAARLMSGLAPQNEQEGLLIAQMAAIHITALHLLAKAANPSHGAHVVEICTARATKLLNAYARHQELLDKKRNGSQVLQKIVVERVEVKEGGQAIVGAVNKLGGGGIKSKSEE